jgi:hypothetical protein
MVDLIYGLNNDDSDSTIHDLRILQRPCLSAQGRGGPS